MAGVPLHAALTKLKPGSVYHVRAVAANAAGVKTSRDFMFTTLRSPINHGSLHLIGCNNAIRRILRLTRLDTLMTIHSSTDPFIARLPSSATGSSG